MDENKGWTVRNIGDALSATKPEDSMRLIGLTLQLASLAHEIAVGPVVDKVRAYEKVANRAALGFDEWWDEERAAGEAVFKSAHDDETVKAIMRALRRVASAAWRDSVIEFVKRAPKDEATPNSPTLGGVVRFRDSKGHDHQAIVTSVSDSDGVGGPPIMSLAYFDAEYPDGGDIVKVADIRHKTEADEHEAWWRRA